VAKPIRILLVDDSTFLRHMLAKRLEAYPEIQVVGHAADGLDALAKVRELTPDVVIMDVEMPQMDGLTALQRLMEQRPTPVVMLSAHTQRGARTTIQALMRGAVDFVAKPASNMDIKDILEELIAKIKVAASAAPPAPSLTRSVAASMAKTSRRPFRDGAPLIVIGASTGGPRALQWVLAELPGDLQAAIVVVQHMPAGFTQSLAQRLNEHSRLTVQEAASGQSLELGLALVAPGDHHLLIGHQGRVLLDQGPRRNHLRPAIDITMESAARRHGAAVIGVVLTGMGTDGTDGAAAIRAAGGRVIAEHESTSIIYGMPGSVVAAGLADRVEPIGGLASVLAEFVHHGRH
jgi:two-component system, chemotaxis family, protein-glutamate methylesterase/glutaminase